MTTEAEKPWLVWSWRYGSLSVEDYADRDEAIDAAIHVGEYGEASFHHVEGPDGIVPREVIDAAHEERWERERIADSERPKPTHRLMLRVLDDTYASDIGYYLTEADALADLERMGDRFPGRLKVEKIR